VERPEGRRLLWRSKRRWDNSMETGLKEIGRQCVGWIHLTWDTNRRLAVANMVMNFPVL
jgi:hypothetical protein